ncbi:hypothetical protein [Halobellus sp. GM3]|uniref:hypothetical protein n=1 Tax=Halobellus sp. GM3 TaxID=3458410 RepID=UPI00403DDD08
MTGMKRGAGEDPFADESEGTESDRSDVGDAGETDEHSNSTSSAERAATSTPSRETRAIQIPYKFRRDGVQDGRNRVPLFLTPETKNGERDALRELEDRFDENVSLTDLREALVMVGLDHRSEVEAQLEEWGYGMTFE